MSQVVPIRACARCGKLGSPRQLWMNDEIVNTFNACEACVSSGQVGLEKLRTVFYAMIAAGIPRDLANDTMSYMLREWTP